MGGLLFYSPNLAGLRIVRPRDSGGRGRHGYEQPLLYELIQILRIPVFHGMKLLDRRLDLDKPDRFGSRPLPARLGTEVVDWRQERVP